MASSVDLIQGVRELNAARPGLVKAYQYAEGEPDEIFASAKLREKIADMAGDYLFRLSRKPVTGMANRLRLASIGTTSGGADTTLDEIRRVNLMPVQERELIFRTLEFGEAYALIEDTGELNTDPDEGEEYWEPGTPKITYLSPLHTRAVYDSDGIHALYVIHAWQVADKRVRCDVYYRDRVEAWITIDPRNSFDPPAEAAAWTPYVEEDADDHITSYPEGTPEEIPIKHARTQLVHGRPVHADAYGPQNLITKTLVTLSVSIEAQGWSERYGLVDPQSRLDASNDNPGWDDDADAPTGTADQPGGLRPIGTSMRRAAGTFTDLDGYSEVGEWRVGVPKEIVAPLELLIRLMATVTDTPLWELDPGSIASGNSAMSGVAFRRADMPAQAKADDLKEMLTMFFREVYGYALALATDADAADVEVRWAPPGVENDPEFWQVATTKAEAGVPQAQILAEANYLPEQIQAWSDAEGDSMALVQRVNILDKLGSALQKIGQAKALMPEVLDDAALAELVERVMDGVGGDDDPA